MRNSAGILVLGPHLCTRIRVRATIGLLKMPLLICQARWREGRNAFRISGNSSSPLGAQKKDICVASQTLLSGIRLRLWKKEMGSLRSDVFQRRTSTGSEPFSILNCLDASKFVLLRVFTLVELICSKSCLNSRLKSAKSPLLVDVHSSKTSLLKLLNEARHKNENHETRFDKALFHERYYLWHGNARFSFKRGGT